MPFVVRSEPQSRREDAILVVTNHTTQDLYIRVSLFDMDGNEMRRGPLAGVGAGNLFPDFGFPLSATVRHHVPHIGAERHGERSVNAAPAKLKTLVSAADGVHDQADLVQRPHGGRQGKA
ncbi:MAG TPA: hypothetical protein PK362_10700, partial [Elusimicrobiota bacterium]|nr:hypothetical protein [Elusimicrobiota bacterium]